VSPTGTETRGEGEIETLPSSFWRERSQILKKTSGATRPNKNNRLGRRTGEGGAAATLKNANDPRSERGPAQKPAEALKTKGNAPVRNEGGRERGGNGRAIGTT